MLRPEHPILTTGRLLLRPYRNEDWPAVHAYGADPIVSQYQAWGPNTAEDTQAFVADCVRKASEPEPDAYFFAIIQRAEDQLIGGCNLSITDEQNRTAMLGYTIAPAFWNQGIMTEAARALLLFGFETLKLHRVISWSEPENIGSWRVMEKIGMRREGHEREAVWFKDAWHDWLRYAILDHEWRTQNAHV